MTRSEEAEERIIFDISLFFLLIPFERAYPYNDSLENYSIQLAYGLVMICAFVLGGLRTFWLRMVEK